MFADKEQGQDFFNDYINEVDVVDNNCKNGEEVEHVDYCTCGIVELDDDDNPVLFYNKRNQIFFMECGGQVFLPPQNTKNNIEDMNLTNRLIRRCRRLDVEQKQKYIELGKSCEESMKEKEQADKIELSEEKSTQQHPPTQQTPTSEEKPTKKKVTRKPKKTSEPNSK
jgi:hypothetical protein